MQEKGYLALVLHAHLPYVRHPEHEYFLEENWFYEAVTEAYIPLIQVFENLLNDRIHFRLTMSFSPPLVSMFADSLLRERYVRSLENLIELAGKEVQRTRFQPEFHHLAKMYLDKFTRARHIFVEKYNGNLIKAFKKFQDSGNLEIITSATTHGYLPLMDIHPEAVRTQIQIGVETHKKHFGSTPKGIWLPECGYHPEHDKFLHEAGIRYFFTDSHGILHASPRPKYGTFAPIYCPTGVAAFGRDMESSKQVWSAKEGYPGDYNYREFYRDIGYDLDYEYISPHLPIKGTRTHTGIKYYKITGRTNEKQPYDRHAAWERAAVHAGNFMFNREQQILHLSSFLDRKPIIVSPYDAELFGHWWFEGPDWLELFIRKTAYNQNVFKMITPSEYLEIYPVNQVSTPSMSSWGYKGYNEVWLEGSNDWIYRHLHKATERMIELANTYHTPTDLERRALNQAARELLLAQSSDWAFIMKTGTMVPYAVKRTKEHLWNFTKLYENIRSGSIDSLWLEQMESKNNIFPEMDYAIYRSQNLYSTANLA
jgi:1,4-alpha-glucan branching enzyme